MTWTPNPEALNTGALPVQPPEPLPTGDLDLAASAVALAESEAPAPARHRDERAMTTEVGPTPSPAVFGDPSRGRAQEPFTGYNLGQNAGAHVELPGNPVDSYAEQPLAPAPPRRRGKKDKAVQPTGYAPAVQRPAKSGWRLLVKSCTFGQVDPGWSNSEIEYEALIQRMRTPLRSEGENVAVMQLKGGVGKTVTSLAAAENLAARISGNVLAIDGNTSWGTFQYRIGQPSAHDCLDLLDDRKLFLLDEHGHPIAAENTSEGQFAQYTGKGATSLERGGLELLAGPREVGCDEQLTPEGYAAIMQVAQRHYRVRVTDCGTNVKDPLTRAVLDHADLVVIVATLDADGIEGATKAIEFMTKFPTDRKGQPKVGLEARPYIGLARRAVVVVNEYASKGKAVDKTPEQAVEHFTRKLQDLVPGHAPVEGRVVRMPHDGHLRKGGAVRDDLLKERTKRAFLRLSAAIAADFSRDRSRRTQVGA